MADKGPHSTATGELTEAFYVGVLTDFVAWVDERERADLSLETIEEYVSEMFRKRKEAPHNGVSPDDVDVEDHAVLAFWAAFTGRDARVHLQRLSKDVLIGVLAGATRLKMETEDIFEERYLVEEEPDEEGED